MADDEKKSEVNITSSDKLTTMSKSAINTTDRINTELNLCKSVTSTEKYKHILPRLSRFRVTEHFIVIWLDFNISESDEDTCSSINKLQHIVNSVKIFNDADKCINFLTDLKNETVFMIISNELSQWIVPLIEDFPQLHVIYLLDSSQSESEHWIKGQHKVQSVFTSIDTICNALKRNIHKFATDLTSISILPDSPNVNFDELDQSFMYSQILKEIIIEIKHDEKAKKEFVNFCRGQYANNEIQLNIVNTFERDYELHSPVWWYTKEPFIYTTLNQALRKQDIEIIIKMGFFLQDLHRQIEQIHSKTHQITKMTIYRGQGMANMEFEKMKKNKGGLLSFNNFLSTSIDKQVSLAFTSSAQDDPDLTGILFQIEIDSSISSVTFAALDDISFYLDSEKEILFSMHTIFRIGNMIQIEDRLWQVNLTLTSDNDQRLMDLTAYIRKEIGDQTGWVRMAGLMFRMGKFDKAIEIYNTLLERITDGDREKLITSLPTICINNAAAHASLADYSTALEYSKMTLEIMQKLLPSNHLLSARIYNNIGTIYKLSNEFSTAFSYYEKAIEIVQNFFPINDRELAISYCNMANMYETLGDYSTALSFYEKTLDLDQKSLPSIHPDRATTFNNIGEAHRSLGDYSTALLYYQKSLEIQENSLPLNYIDVATTYSNIGLVHESMEDYATALSYYKKALQFEQNSLPLNHPNLAITYSNIGGLYQLLEDYPTALSYYKKTLEIQQKCLEPNHPDLAITYNDMGLTYKSMEDYATALSYYEKTLDIQKSRLSSDHPHLAVTYHNLGDLYILQENYSTALSYYDKALQIKQKSLPPNHPTFATLYNNIGEVYRATEQCSTALTFYEKTLDIKLKSVSPNRLDIANTYERIGLVYKSLKDYLTALSYYKKTLEIQEEYLSSDDPELITTYKLISELYLLLKDYSTALSYYEKTLQLEEKCLPSDDPSLVTSFHNMSLLLDKLSRYEEAIEYAEWAVDIACRAVEFDESETQEIQDHIIKLRQKLRCT